VGKVKEPNGAVDKSEPKGDEGIDGSGD